MALSERLALLVTLNPEQAISGLNKIGKAADRNLAKTINQTDAMGKKFQKVGVGMAATGGLLTLGLFKAAEASERANLSLVKLENSLANNPRTAGEASKAYVELADSIQSKTAAENDSIVAGEAVLAQFALTGDQIKELTPLVVDYARKTGTDVPSAAATVGKALLGNTRALKAIGISYKVTGDAATDYKNIQGLLADKVGGFAEAEGKTFAGSLERLKNQLGDLEENVGKGAVDAFSSMFGVINDGIGKLNRVNPALEETVGKLATFGSVGLIAAGGLSFVVGKAIELRDSIKDIPNRLSDLASGLGAMKGKLAVAAIGAGIFAFAIFKASERAERLRQAARELREEADATGKTLEQVAVDKLVKVFTESNDTADAMDDLGLSFADLRGPLQGSSSEFDSWADSLRAADIAANGTDRQSVLLIGRVKTLRSELGQAKTVTDRTADASKELGLAQGDLADETDGAATAAEDAKKAHDDLTSAIKDQFDAITSGLEADLKFQDALDGIAGSLKDNGNSFDLNTDKGRENARALLEGKDALAGMIQARFDETGSLDQATAAGDLYVENLKTQLRNAGLTEDQIAGLVEQYGLVPRQVATTIKTSGVGVVKAELDSLIGKLGVIQGTYVAQVGLGALYGSGRAKGGSIYRAGGGPSGTDTVNAWLSPGEFVMRKSAVDRIGVANLNAMNKGGGAGGNTYAISVSTLDARTAGRVVVDAIRSFEGSNGKGWRQ